MDVIALLKQKTEVRFTATAAVKTPNGAITLLLV
jgi:hypothetical protein